MALMDVEVVLNMVVVEIVVVMFEVIYVGSGGCGGCDRHSR